MATVTSSKNLPCSRDKLLMVLLIVCDTLTKAPRIAEGEERGARRALTPPLGGAGPVRWLYVTDQKATPAFGPS